MLDSMSEQLRQDVACESLLECFHGLKDLDREVFRSIAAHDGTLTVDEIAEIVGRERSTAYRSVQRLLDAGVVRKQQVNYENGGYYHVFEQATTDEVADEMQRMLNEWYAEMGQLIGEYRQKYDDVSTSASTAEQSVPRD